MSARDGLAPVMGPDPKEPDPGDNRFKKIFFLLFRRHRRGEMFGEHNPFRFISVTTFT